MDPHTDPVLPAQRERAHSPLVHRVVLRSPSQSAERVLPDTRRLVAGWLEDKYQCAPLVSGLHVLRDGVRIAVATTFGRDGEEDALRLQLREDTPDALWRTTVVARRGQGRRPALVAVDLERFPQRPGLGPAARPRLIRQLVEELDPRDGPCPVTSNAWSIAAHQVDELVGWLTDPARTLPLLLAAPPLDADPLWQSRVEEVFAASCGAASMFQLADTEAVDAFRRVVFAAHRVAPGALRTFLPVVDPAWPPDASRHRVLSGARLCDPQDRAYKAVPAQVHELACAVPWPAALREVAFPTEDAQASADMREVRNLAAQIARREDTEVSQLREEVATLSELLELADAGFAELRGELDLSRRRIAAQGEATATAQSGWEAELEDHLGTLDRAERLQEQVVTLQRALAAQGRLSEAYTLAPDTAVQAPQSFEELFERAADFPHLVLPLDPDPALRLDGHAKRGVWAAKAWQALRSLEDYVVASGQGFRGGFYEFCCNPPAGLRPYPVKQVAMAESDQSMERWSRERRFAVPERIEAQGCAEMVAHLKLDTGGIAPRVHFLDRSASHGLLVVGYIGQHLTNTRT
ncbi:hypothetical protein [Streptacidiphilus sp. EB103A]|uniref:hypothetical protein n=1 Tax=Streptacidiphilus sp. EB103A TaxID=3156275 RepID=UPI003513B382